MSPDAEDESEQEAIAKVARDKERLEEQAAEQRKTMIAAAQADRLRQARISAGFKTGREAAQHLGLAESTYMGHENGSRGISVQQLAKYARAFGIAASWLTYGDEGDIIRKLHPDLLSVEGIIQPGVWIEKDAKWKEKHGRTGRIPVVASKDLYNAYQYAVRVQGVRVGRLAGPGEYLIVAKWEDIEWDRASLLLAGRDYFLIRRERGPMYSFVAWKGERIVETLLKNALPVPEVPFAWTIETAQEGEQLAVGDVLKIIGIIIGKYTPRDAIGDQTK